MLFRCVFLFYLQFSLQHLYNPCLEASQWSSICGSLPVIALENYVRPTWLVEIVLRDSLIPSYRTRNRRFISLLHPFIAIIDGINTCRGNCLTKPITSIHANPSLRLKLITLTNAWKPEGDVTAFHQPVWKIICILPANRKKAAFFYLQAPCQRKNEFFRLHPLGLGAQKITQQREKTDRGKMRNNRSITSASCFPILVKQNWARHFLYINTLVWNIWEYWRACLALVFATSECALVYCRPDSFSRPIVVGLFLFGDEWRWKIPVLFWIVFSRPTCCSSHQTFPQFRMYSEKCSRTVPGNNIFACARMAYYYCCAIRSCFGELSY